MSTVARHITAEELFRMPGDQRRELVKGELRTMAPAEFEHGAVVNTLAFLLTSHVKKQKLGVVLGAETGFALSRHPDTVRGADVAFVDASRISPGVHPPGYWEGAPDLAVEVVSPHDRLQDVEDKVDQYLNAGARLVWVVNPRRRTVVVHRPASPPMMLSEVDVLDGQEVVSGFSCSVGEIFG